jgi:hypothetical protein
MENLHGNLGGNRNPITTLGGNLDVTTILGGNLRGNLGQGISGLQPRGDGGPPPLDEADQRGVAAEAPLS